MSLTRVTSSSDVMELATGLLDPRRELPWGVISIPVTAEAPLIDVEQLIDEAGDVCRFFMIQTGTLTRELDAMLPDRCQVYGGASRIYPVGTQWTIEPEQSPLRFAHDTKTAATAVDTLVTDALGMAQLAGLFAKPAPTSVRASGEVRTLLAGGTRAFVGLDAGGFATIVHELTFPEIPLEWVIREEQRVDGLYDPETKRLALDVVRVDSSELLKHYPHGTVTLAFVVSVERQSGVLAVHPSLPITVARADVSMTLMTTKPSSPHLRSFRAETRGLPKPAPGLHRARTSDTTKPTITPIEPAAAPGTRRSSALITTQLTLKQERDRTRQLEEQLKHVGGESAFEKVAIMRLELGEIHAENLRLRDQLRKMRSDQQAQRTMLRKARQTVTAPNYVDRRERFDRAEDWVRHEIYLAWVERMDAGDRARWPLPARYTVGERFVPSLEQLGNPSREKALKAVVDVLTGRARELPTRASHPLRNGDRMSAADMVRTDGARCMRVHIEKKVASARRLHYWQRDDGGIELSRVVLHDDMEP